MASPPIGGGPVQIPTMEYPDSNKFSILRTLGKMSKVCTVTARWNSHPTHFLSMLAPSPPIHQQLNHHDGGDACNNCNVSNNHYRESEIIVASANALWMPLHSLIYGLTTTTWWKACKRLMWELMAPASTSVWVPHHQYEAPCLHRSQSFSYGDLRYTTANWRCNGQSSVLHVRGAIIMMADTLEQ